MRDDEEFDVYAVMLFIVVLYAVMAALMVLPCLGAAARCSW